MTQDFSTVDPGHPPFPTEWTVRQVIWWLFSWTLSHLHQGDFISGSSDKPDLVLCNNSVAASLCSHLQGRLEDLGPQNCGLCHCLTIMMISIHNVFIAFHHIYTHHSENLLLWKIRIDNWPQSFWRRWWWPTTRCSAPLPVHLAGRSGSRTAWSTVSPSMREGLSLSTGPCQGLQVDLFRMVLKFRSHGQIRGCLVPWD